jgi:acyl-CoA synthetase (NDP forming)
VNDLSFLLSPRSIAIVGASDDFAKVNGRTLKYLLSKGYAGEIYPVNPKYQRIDDLDCYPSIATLPEAVDLAVVALPARLVARTMRELGQRGVRSAVVFSSGFAEIGEEGRVLEREVTAAAKASGVRLCGPNCLGVINAFDCVMATFGQYAEGETRAGPVAFVTQSGAFGTAIAALARRRGIGLGYFVNTGNEADIDFVAMMRAVLEDDRIRVGAGYIEGLRNGAGLIELAEAALSKGKPLVLTKVGRTEAGARAAMSHTGSLAGSDAVFDGVARGKGIIRARNEEHMLDIVEVLASCALPGGSAIGIVTQSGGAGVLMADRAEELGLSVPVLSDSTQQILRKVIPAFGAAVNPVDITGQFVAEPHLLSDATQAMLSDPHVHIAIVWLQLMDAYADTLVEIFRELKRTADKPFVVCWVAAPDKALQALREAGIAVLRGAEPAVDAVAALVNYAKRRGKWLADEGARRQLKGPKSEDVEVVAAGVVPSMTAARWLQDNGISLTPSRIARTAEEAVDAAHALQFPVALKIESPDISHKTEADGIRLSLRSAESVRQAYGEIMASAKRYRAEARLQGVLVQAMAEPGVELVVGLKKDAVFGIVIMVGLGGIHIEVFKDVVFRAVPVTVIEAHRMLDELRGQPLLDGVRGSKPIDRQALAELISRVSLFGAALGPRLLELDLNPVITSEKGAVAVDWLLVMDHEA